MKAKLNIAGATLNQTPIDWDNNVNNIIAAINEARENNIDLLCLPELNLTGYGCDDLFLTEWLPNKALQILQTEILPYTENIIVNIGLPIKYKGQLYNCCCLIQDQEILGFTAKQFLANDGVHYEHRWFKPWKPGKIGYLELDGNRYPFGDYIYKINDHKIAFEICEDAWRPNRPGILHAQNDVDYILNPSASPFELEKTKIRQDLVLKSSKDFDCTYIYCNLLGNESGRLIFDGEILIAEKGTWIASNPLLSFKNYNLAIPTENNIILPVADRNEEFTKAVCLGLYDYLRKSSSKSFVLSLSGGADSSTCAVLVSEMIKRGIDELGVEIFKSKAGLFWSNEELFSKILICAYQGTENSSSDTFTSSKELCNNVGATFYHWDIDHEVGSYIGKIEKSIGKKLDWKTNDIALQNIQARTRSPIIWLLTNISNALLITTSNRSEGDVGYATMDGDTSGSISPIAGIDKPFIRNWLKWAEKALGYESLKYVNNLTPSAELRPTEMTQSDEVDLMPYDILLQIETLAIRDRLSPIDTFNHLINDAELDKEVLKNYITKFFKLWSRNQWKRERTAPSFHLDKFNVDPKSWMRFPILSGSYNRELEELSQL